VIVDLIAEDPELMLQFAERDVVLVTGPEPDLLWRESCKTIAEFAENAEIIQMLTSLGVDYAQGYGIAQPQRVLKAVNS
jgi:hypothetical protein